MKFVRLEFNKLSFGYQDELVFKDIDFVFPVEEAVIFYGPTGSGKNTLLKLLAGLEDPVAGSFRINGQDIGQLSEQERFEFRRFQGYGFSQGGLLQNRTIRQNLEVALEALSDLGSEGIYQRVEELLKTFKLQEAAHQRPGTVSGGTRMACCLARALIHKPELLLLNHPTSGLNADLIEALLGEIERQRQAGTLRHIFLISENRMFAERLKCKSVSVFRDRLEAA